MASAACGRNKLLIVMLLLLQGSILFPQDKRAGKENPDKNQAAFKLSVGVVVVHATVTDKKGNAVSDLSREDFRIYEDGKLQRIENFALETYKSAQDSAAMPGKPSPETPTTVEPDLLQPRRISMVIDDVSSAPGDRFLMVKQAIAKFIEKDMEPGDQIAIFSASGRVQIPFSDDRQFLLAELADLQEKLNWRPVERSECPVLTDLQAQSLYNKEGDPLLLNAVAEETIKCLRLNPARNPVDAEAAAEQFANYYQIAQNHALHAATSQYLELEHRNRTLLRSLRQYLRSLRLLDGTKSAIFFSDGFLHRYVAYELQDVVEQALRSGIVLSTINMRGLFNPHFISASDRITSTVDTYFKKPGALTEDALAQEDPLYELAHETGGSFFHNNNDFYQGIRQISDRKDYYVLTYAMPQQKPDGRYHSIKVEVLRPGLEVSHRKGYYAPKEETTFERQKKEDILQALYTPGNLSEIPMGLSYNYYQDSDTTYVISLLIKMDICDLCFLDEDSRHRNLIQMVVAAFDETERYIKGLEKSIDFRLTDTSYASLLDSGVTSKLEFKLPIGRYRIRAVVREACQGKMGSLTKTIEIP